MFIAAPVVVSVLTERRDRRFVARDVGSGSSEVTGRVEAPCGRLQDTLVATSQLLGLRARRCLSAP